MEVFREIAAYLAARARDLASHNPWLDEEDLAQSAAIRALEGGLDPTSHTLPECLAFCEKALEWELQDRIRRRRCNRLVTLVGTDADGEDLLAALCVDPSDAPIIVEKADQIQRILQEVQNLPDEHRRVLVRYYLDDRTLESIAQEDHTSIPTVHRRIKAALADVRRRIEKGN